MGEGWVRSDNFIEAVNRLERSCEQVKLEECACPVEAPVLCFKCAWKDNLKHAAEEVLEWIGK